MDLEICNNKCNFRPHLTDWFHECFLAHVRAWCREATGHYLSQCLQRSITTPGHNECFFSTSNDQWLAQWSSLLRGFSQGPEAEAEAEVQAALKKAPVKRCFELGLVYPDLDPPLLGMEGSLRRTASRQKPRALDCLDKVLGPQWEIATSDLEVGGVKYVTAVTFILDQCFAVSGHVTKALARHMLKPIPHKTYRTRAPATKPGSSWEKVYIKSNHSPFKSQLYGNSIDRVVLCQGVWYCDHMTSKSCRKS